MTGQPVSFRDEDRANAIALARQQGHAPGVYTVQSSCSWCHDSNPLAEPHCRTCGHDAHRPRRECRCGRCRPHAEGHGR